LWYRGRRVEANLPAPAFAGRYIIESHWHGCSLSGVRVRGGKFLDTSIQRVKEIYMYVATASDAVTVLGYGDYARPGEKPAVYGNGQTVGWLQYLDADGEVHKDTIGAELAAELSSMNGERPGKMAEVRLTLGVGFNKNGRRRTVVTGMAPVKAPSAPKS